MVKITVNVQVQFDLPEHTTDQQKLLKPVMETLFNVNGVLIEAMNDEQPQILGIEYLSPRDFEVKDLDGAEVEE